jgi:hypothetical protein
MNPAELIPYDVLEMIENFTIQTTATATKLSQSAIDNLKSIEEEIETSSPYFKPKPGKPYLVKIDPSNKIEPVVSDRFKDVQGKPWTRYQFKIAHVNNGK